LNHSVLRPMLNDHDRGVISTEAEKDYKRLHVI